MREIDGPAGAIVLRAFGTQAPDLDVEFDAADRATVVTEILARCARTRDDAALDRELLWGLGVGVRLHALVVICLLSGARELSLRLTCPADGCEEEIEVALPLGELARAAQDAAASDPAETSWGDMRFRPRLPTGEDLRRWSAELPSDAEMVAALGGPRIAGGDIAPELVAAVEESLAAVDPLVDARVRSACPECGQELDLAVDLEGETVALARRAQGTLLQAVATLAGAFHWSEHEILGLGVRRRSRYLALLAEAEG